MPRSKRNKQIELAKTKKRGLEWKKRLFEEVRSCVDKYENVFIFSVSDMRNNKMKYVREQWKHSRFFIGKNKIMAMALGRFAEEEYKPNLHKLGQQIKGQRGLLFSNKPVQEVLSWFRSYSEGDYARSGNTATETIHLPAGPLTMFPHNLEPYLRELGLPTTLEKGVIHLVKDHEVCKAGDVLTPETAKIIKLLGYEMAEFHLTIDCVWSKDGTFMQFTESIDTDTKEKKKQKSKLSVSSEIKEENNEVEDEQMEVEQNDEESSDSEEEEDDDVDDDEESKEVKNSASDSYCLPALDQSEEVENNASDSFTLPDIVKSPNIVATTSTPKAKSDDVVENITSGIKEKDNTAALECSMEEVSEKIDDRNDIEEISEETNNKNDMEEISEETNNKNDREEISEETNNKNDMEEVSEETNNKNDREEISEETDNKNGIEEIDSKNHMGEMSEKTDAKAEENEEIAPTSKRGRPRVSAKTPRTAKKQTKRDSLCKTPDPNTSQDSPVFRELRNRSVKFSRKKKK